MPEYRALTLIFVSFVILLCNGSRSPTAGNMTAKVVLLFLLGFATSGFRPA